jgi:hypothetical protein
MSTDVSNLKIKADSGDIHAAFAIFDAYADTTAHSDKDWDVALHYLTLASDAENPDALMAMGSLLITGIKINKDISKGMALLRRAKELGNKDVDDLVYELDVALGVPDHEVAKPVEDDTDADDMDNPNGIDLKDSPEGEDHSQPKAKSQKDSNKKTKQSDLGTPDDTLTADQLLRMIKTKLSQLEINETMSAMHHFDILKITIADSESTKELLAIYDVLDNPTYVKTLYDQPHAIIGWNPKEGVFYLDTGDGDKTDEDQVLLPKRSYQRGEVRNLIFAVFITIVVMIIFLNLLYAVRPL